MSVIIHNNVALSRLLAATQGRNGYGPYSLSNRLQRNLGVTTLKQLLEIKAPRIAQVIALRRDDLNAFMRMLHEAKISFSDEFHIKWSDVAISIPYMKYHEAMAVSFLQALRNSNVPLKELMVEVPDVKKFDWFWRGPNFDSPVMPDVLY